MRKIVLSAALAAVAMVVLPVASAQAGLLATTTDCELRSVTQPFTPWGDTFDYVLVPDGAVENGKGEWRFEGGASIVDGNSPFYANSDSDSHSVLIPEGATAETGTMCIGKEHPTLRFFAQNAGSWSSMLVVRVAIETSWGREFSLPVGLERGNNDWEPSKTMRLIVNNLNMQPGMYTPVEFQFTARGGDWRIDDVYVDPKRH